MTKDSFADSLLDEVQNHKEESDAEIGDVVVNANENNTTQPLSNDIIKHWLNFAVYYEKAAAIFIGEWLKTTPEDDALVHFAHQIEDEANHYRWLKRYLYQYSDKAEQFEPPSEWRFLMEEYYPKLPTLIERLAAHNIAAETGALGFAEFYFDRMPEKIKETVAKVMKDEKYHIAFGKRLLNKYCISDEQKTLARRAAHESLQHMRKARSAFVNI